MERNIEARGESKRRVGRRHRQSVALVAVLAFALMPISAVRAAVVSKELVPTPGATSQANITLENVTFGGTATDTSTVQSGSTLNLTYDTETNILSLTSVHLLGSDVDLVFGPSFHPCVRNLVISLDPGAQIVPAQLDGNGNFQMFIGARFDGSVGNTCVNDMVNYYEVTTVAMTGRWFYDPGPGGYRLTDFTGVITPIAYNLFGVDFLISGSMTFNFYEHAHWWSDAVDTGSGWRYLSPFGFFNVTGDPWIYHQELDWFYGPGTSSADLWLYYPKMAAWLWTSDTTFPFIYRNWDNTWLYYLPGTTNPCWFHNQNTDVWEAY